ncbi:MAG: DNA-protecting protein DprA, partial [Gammaproteobacteria bacterium]|nr:DNA-protecting protein DprA [Gammaproteobacteria bacterium]
MHSELHYWLAALHLPEISARNFFRALSQFADIKQLFHAHRDALKAAGLNDKQMTALRNPNWRLVEEDLLWEKEDDHHLLAFTDPAYPALLKEIDDPPLLLYVVGNKQALQQIQIAMVGARKATSVGMKNAEQFAYTLAQAGIAITSGLALGIDGASHRGAIAAQGITLGVFGTGLHQIYPPSHRELAAEIVRQQGALISEFPLSIFPHPANFPRRNRIIAGLSVGVLVVEAAIKSGSLITARYALEQGREVFA